MGVPILELRGVSRPYGEHGEWRALEDATLRVVEGEFIAIAGPSGSGKSTLLNILGLLDDNWTGEYLIDGVDVRSLSSAERDHLRYSTFGFVFQSSYVNPWDSVDRNVAFALSAQGASLRTQREESARALDVGGLDSKAQSLARYLSGGERQRLAIARAISTRPRIVLADEPTGNLDSKSTERVVDLFESLKRDGTTVILVTHDMEVASHAQRVVTVRDGHIVGGGGGVPDTQARGALKIDPQTTSAHTTGRSPRSRWPRGRVLATLLDRFARAVNNTTSRPVRSLALAAAFGLAITGLIGAAGVGASASQQIGDRLTAAARDELRVGLPAEIAADGRAHESWVTAIESLPHVLRVGEIGAIEGSLAQTSRLGITSTSPEASTATVISASGAALEMLEVDTAPADLEPYFDEGGRVVLVGVDVAEALGVSEGSFGHEIWIGFRPYSVVGVIESSSREPSLTRSVVIPLQDEFASARQLVVRTTPGLPAAVAEAIPLAISPDSPGSIQVSTVGDLRNLRLGVSTDLQGLLLSLSVALLLVAILSVSAAMFLSVQARLQELALSRALGLSPAGVGLVFVFEGALLGLAGALMGVAGGLLVAVAVAAFQGWSAVVPWATIVLAPGLGLVAGGLSSAVPALRASQVNPADAIR